MALEHKGSVELSEEESVEFERQVEQADRDLDEDRTKRMVAIRWGTKQLKMIRSAAELRGVPYQIYIRNATYEAAVRDTEQAMRLDKPLPDHWWTANASIARMWVNGQIGDSEAAQAFTKQYDWLSPKQIVELLQRHKGEIRQEVATQP